MNIFSPKPLRRIICNVVYLVLIIFLLLSSGCTVFPQLSVENKAPVAYIDSIEPINAILGQAVSFTGYGTDEDGIITAYNWRSSIDGGIGRSASISVTSLSAGSHTIYFKVKDNSGEWSMEASRAYTVIPNVSSLPSITEFSAAPAEIMAGDTATLRWNIANATIASIDQNIGSVPATGQKTVSPAMTTVYTLTAKNNSGSVTKNIQIMVKGLPVINSFTVNPSTIALGDKALLNWDVSDSLDISITPDIGIVSHNKGTIAVAPTATTVYNIKATNARGSITREFIVEVTSEARQLYRLEKTVIMNESGTVRQDGTVDMKNNWVGDDDFNNGMQLFYSFDIADLPNNALLSTVKLDLRGATEYIRPFTLGKLRVYSDQFGLLDSSDFSTGFPDGVENGLLFTFTSIPNITFSLPQYSINELQSMANGGARRYQIRLQFERFTNYDNEWDFVRFTETIPKLIIEYKQ